MKVVVATAALVTLLASSALAQTPRYGYEPDAYSAYGAYRGPGAAFATPRPYATYPDYGSYGPRNSFSPPYDVYDSRGWYIGSDPDGRVRSQLQRDPSNE
jgi:hypothetical protein